MKRLLMTAAACLSFPVGAQADGAELFKSTCAACHGQAGEGVPGFAPPLAGALGAHLASPDAARYLSQVVVSGLSGRIRLADGQFFTGAMPSQAAASDESLAAILSYVARTLNAAPEGFAVTPSDVATARASRAPVSEVRALRAALLKDAK